MTPCALCAADSRESVLAFHHLRKAEQVTLEIALCRACGDKIEKHLKRAIPKRLMQFSMVRVPAALRDEEEPAHASAPHTADRAA